MILDGLISTFDTPEGSAAVLDEPVAALLAGLLDIRDGQDVADPFCRTGETLIAVASLAHRTNVSDLRLHGYDVSPTLMQVASLRALRSPFDAQIDQRDALFDPPEAAGRLRRFDRIVTAPPVNLRVDLSPLERDPYRQFRIGVQSRIGADIARIEHILASLRPEGRAVVLVSYLQPVQAKAADPSEVAADLTALIHERDAAEARFDADAAHLPALLGGAR